MTNGDELTVCRVDWQPISLFSHCIGSLLVNDTATIMSADENDAPATTELSGGDTAATEVTTEHAQSTPEVASSDHVTDGTSSPQAGNLLSLPFRYSATLCGSGCEVLW